MKILVFDFDGVIIDSKKMYIKVIKKALEENGQNIPLKEIDAKLIPSIKGTIDILVSKDIENRKEIVENAEKRVIDLTASEGLENLKLGENVVETLEELKINNKLFLLSNSHSGFIKKVLEKHNLNRYFNEIITLDSDFSSKVEALKYISKTEKVDISEMIYIGDTEYDIEIAKKIGCKIIIIYNNISWNYPHINKIKNLKPDFLLDKLSDLIHIIE